jgi:hypothetical protein
MPSKKRRTRPMALVRRDWFDEALALFEIMHPQAQGDIADELGRWQRLRNEGHTPPPAPEGAQGEGRSAPPAGEGSLGEGGPRRRRRRRGGRNRHRSDERPQTAPPSPADPAPRAEPAAEAPAAPASAAKRDDDNYGW